MALIDYLDQAYRRPPRVPSTEPAAPPPPPTTPPPPATSDGAGSPPPSPWTAPPPVRGSVGKKPGEWIGSRYIGPRSAPAGPQPPPGFDYAKWGDPTHQTTKYIGGRYVADAIARGLSTDEIMQGLLALPVYAGWTRVGKASLRSPDGNTYDVIYDEDNARGQRRAQYTQTGWGGRPSGSPPPGTSLTWNPVVRPPMPTPASSSADLSSYFLRSLSVPQGVGTPAQPAPALYGTPPPVGAQTATGAPGSVDFATQTWGRPRPILDTPGPTPPSGDGAIPRGTPPPPAPSGPPTSLPPLPLPGWWPTPPVRGYTPLRPPSAPPPGSWWPGPPVGFRPLPVGYVPTTPQGYTQQFSDPATRQLETYLMQLLNELEAQWKAQGISNKDLRKQMKDAKSSAERLVVYLRARAADLQRPAYTGAEGEIMRTQALDPIERDRQAANQRALNNIGSRGFLPTSGIAQELIGSVNRGYDQQRAQAQNELAYRQVTEKRSREQEAQQLLSMIPQVQMGSASQQLSFLQQLDAALNANRQLGLGYSRDLYGLPRTALQDAMAAYGLGTGGGGGTSDLINQLMNLYNSQYAQSAQGRAQWMGLLGQLLPYILGGR